MSNRRLDVAVLENEPSLSRANAQKLIKEGRVSINGIMVNKTSQKIGDEDKIIIDLPEEVIPIIDLKIIYEDDDCVVIDKPVGLLSHSKGAYNPEATVATWLEDKYNIRNTGNRDGIVHRLDRATSGVMICAKTPEALAWLQKQFSTRKVKKTYLAIVEGTLNPAKAIIDLPIERNPKKPQTFRVGANGKQSVTQYEVIKKLDLNNKIFSLLELRPTTGRTHQLRVHLNHLSYPIVGDEFYGGLKADRLYLHACELELTLPNKQRKIFKSEIPQRFLNPEVTGNA